MLNYSDTKLCSMRRLCALAAAVLITIVLASCGDTFRPVVNPIITTNVDPTQFRREVVITQSPATFTGPCPGGAAPPCGGALMQIDVAADTNSSGVAGPGFQANYIIGRNPVQGTSAGAGSTFWTADRGTSDPNSGTLSFLGITTGQTATVALPAGAAPSWVTATQNTQANAEIVLAALTGTNQVAFVDTTQRAVSSVVNVGTQPVAIGALPSLRKAYVVNRGSNNVTVISLTDGAVLGTIAVGTEPVWIVMHSSGTAAYVVNRTSNDVSVINTATDTVAATVPVGTTPNFGIFDSKLLRLYVTNPGSNTVSVIDGSTLTGTVLSTVTAGTTPIAVAPLADGTKFYVANSGSNDVSVFDAASFQLRGNPIPVGTNPVFIAASLNSAKVYVANHDSTLNASGAVAQPAGVTVIRTQSNATGSADTVVTTLPAPFVDLVNCTKDIDPTAADQTGRCPRQQPVYIVSQ